VITINFQEGSHVKKGDLLVKINDDDLVAQLERAQFQLKLLTEQLERQRILLEKDAVSRESFDKVQTDYNMVAADISLYKARIEKTEIKASFSGVVGFRYVSDGSYVQPGTKVARLVDNLSLKVEFSIPEKYVSLPLMGSDVAFEVEGFPQTFRAKVYAVDPKVDTKTRTIALRAYYEIENELLLPGMFASVTLITSQSENAIQIPTEAVVPEMNGKSVWVVHNGTAVPTPITTGVRSDLMIEVLSGIAAGDTVITTGLMQLRPGIPVYVQQVN
jgi:membrane fusion protein (multidrug efflux system)